MYMKICSNYQSPSFGIKKINPNNKEIKHLAETMAAGAGFCTASITGIQATEEILGKTQVAMSNSGNIHETTESETALSLSERLASELACIEKGEYDDENKTDSENINVRINMLRNIRTEIKEGAEKYSDKDSKEALSWNLRGVVDELEEMRDICQSRGWEIPNYNNEQEDAINTEISEMLK